MLTKEKKWVPRHPQVIPTFCAQGLYINVYSFDQHSWFSCMLYMVIWVNILVWTNRTLWEVLAAGNKQAASYYRKSFLFIDTTCFLNVYVKVLHSPKNPFAHWIFSNNTNYAWINMISSPNLELRRWFSQEHLKDASEDVS